MLKGRTSPLSITRYVSRVTRLTSRAAFEIARRRRLGLAGLAGGVDGGLAVGVGGDPDLDLGLELLRELHAHRVVVDLIELAGQVDVVGPDLVALRLQGLGDVGGADGAVEVALLVGTALERDFDALEFLDE